MTAGERKQSPHYIPELDPERKKGWNGSIPQAALWFAFVGGLICLVGSGFAFWTGRNDWAVALGIAALILWFPFLMFFPFGS